MNNEEMRGLNELFKRVLTITNITEPSKPVKVEIDKMEQISNRIRREGMLEIEKYCRVGRKNKKGVNQKSGRMLYIRLLKNDDMVKYDRVDRRELNRRAKISDQQRKILENEQFIENAENGKNGNGKQ
jgi:hypothetical protein